jgi:hypothetical protein
MTAPYWRDYLARERTMCAICYREGRGWVRIGDPIPADYQHWRGAFVLTQRGAFKRHVAEFHPMLRVRWAR